MKYLISGAGGQLGREWVRYFDQSAEGDEYVAMDRSMFDITDRNIVKKIIKEEKPDVLINCAAYTNVDGAEKERRKADLVNQIAVRHLARECAAAGVKMVHYSTDYVFPGKREDEQIFPDGYPEDAVTDPINIYGKTKLAGEQALRQELDDYLLVRVSWLCGTDGKNFVSTMLHLGAERDELNVVDDQTGSPTFTFDVVAKTYWLITNNKSGTYHICSEGKITWADFAKEIFTQAVMDVTVNLVTSEEFKTVAKRPAFSLLSNRKIKNEGAILLPWRRGLKDLLSRLQKN